MKRLRILLTFTLALAWLGSAAWPVAVPVRAQSIGPGRGSPSAPVHGVPDGLTLAGWHAIRTQVAKLTAGDGAPNDTFGSVAVNGDTAVVGAQWADVGGNTDQGAAYVFHRDLGGPDAWGQVAKLTVADGATGDWFGKSVSVDGDTAVVGAPYTDIGGNSDQGAAYVFYRDLGGPDAWGQAAKLTAADGAPHDHFGSVSVSGDAAVVGAPLADIGGNSNQGAAYVYYRNQGGADAWGQVARLTAADGAAGDWFGISVSVNGDTAVVGAASAVVGGHANQGAAYVFYRNQGGADTWSQVAKLTAADGAAGNWFGFPLSVSGDTAVVGADGADIGGNAYQGAAYVFYRDKGGPDAWGQTAKLTAADGAAWDRFGVAVSVSGDTAVVGALEADVGGNEDQGAAYVFYRDQGGADAWGQAAKLTAADGAAGDKLGNCASVSGNTAVVGAFSADVGGNADQGAAYVYSPPYAPQSLHLNALLLRWAAGPNPSTYVVTAFARVHDQIHAVAPDVRVAGQWTQPDGSTQNQARLTDANGVARLAINTNLAGDVRFCVGNLVKAGYTFAPAANETRACKTIAVGP